MKGVVEEVLWGCTGKRWGGWMTLRRFWGVGKRKRKRREEGRFGGG